MSDIQKIVYWHFGEYSMSKGCMIEKEYCERYKIPVADKCEWAKEKARR